MSNEQLDPSQAGTVLLLNSRRERIITPGYGFERLASSLRPRLIGAHDTETGEVLIPVSYIYCPTAARIYAAYGI